MARKIVITSGKGGVGKTTVTANLGAKLASFGYKVCLLDIDIGLNNLDVILGIENKIMFDLIDVIENKCRVKQALIKDKRFENLFILPTNHYFYKRDITKEQIKKVVDSLDEDFDYILIDCPAGIDEGFNRAVFSATEAIVVVTPHISSLRDGDKVLSLLSSYDLQNKSILINRVRGDMMIDNKMISITEVCRLLKTKLIGVIPEDDAITTLSSVGGISFNNYSSSRAFTILAENVHTGSKKIYDCSSKYQGILGSIRRTLKRTV